MKGIDPVQGQASLPEDTAAWFIIREFRFPEDYASVFELWSHAGPGIHLRRSDELHEIAKKLQRDPDLFLIADTQGEIIGTVLGGFDGRRGMVYHLAVADAFRGRGVGSALMDNLELQLRAKGCIRIYLLVGQDNLEAIRFYEARGWTRMDLNAFGKDL